MMAMSFEQKKSDVLKVLCLGAHSDDIEIGCGGAILWLLDSQKARVEIVWVVFSGNGIRGNEAARSAKVFLRTAKRKQIIVHDFKDGFFPYNGAGIKESFEELKKDFTPDVIFTHWRDDRHQDHRLISDLTWNTWRDNLILEYEIPKYDGDLGQPNLFIPIHQSMIRKKNKIILESFKSQAAKPWFTEDTFLSLARLRGIESHSERYAEGFYCRKMIL
jgi:LmbE family N-acetylglucosaminyl deacetylase